MIVVDASAAIEQLARSPQAQVVTRLVDELGPCLVPAHFEAECVATLARLRRQGILTSADLREGLSEVEDYPATRVPLAMLLGSRTIDWLGPLSAYDAFYAVLAEAYRVPLLTCDRRLARAFGPRAVYVEPTVF